MEDSQIIDLFFERSEQAIAELDRKYGGAIRKTAANILDNRLDVEECASDTYLGVWNSIPPQKPAPLLSYVCKIARNFAISMLRRDSAAKRNRNFDLVLDELEEVIPSATNLESEYEAKELLDRINFFLSTLSYDDRYLFVRRYWYADPVKLIADTVHQSPGRVSLRLFRLRQKLQNTLEKEGLLA